ncbi:MAG TPA: EamA family transporter, partial [bacterium]|nr:EamA family transporter [bacterium]
MTIAKTSTRPMGPIEWTLLITLSIIWGGSFFLNGVAVHGLPPLTIVVLRLALAAIVLNGI